MQITDSERLCEGLAKTTRALEAFSKAAKRAGISAEQLLANCLEFNRYGVGFRLQGKRKRGLRKPYDGRGFADGS